MSWNDMRDDMKSPRKDTESDGFRLTIEGVPSIMNSNRIQYIINRQIQLPAAGTNYTKKLMRFCEDSR